jgi:hypothetical protein
VLHLQHQHDVVNISAFLDDEDLLRISAAISGSDRLLGRVQRA